MRRKSDRRRLETSHFEFPGRKPEANLALRRIIEMAVARVFGIGVGDLLGPSRGLAPIALARQVAMYLARVVGGLRLAEVGRAFGRDRSTVAYACVVVERRRDDPTFDLTVELLEGIVDRINSLSRRGPEWIY